MMPKAECCLTCNSASRLRPMAMPTPIACELASCELCSVDPYACWVAMTEDRTHLAHSSRET